MNEKLVSSGTVVAAGEVLSSELGAEHVLLNLRDGTYYGLEAAGSDIWKLLQTPIAVSELCRVICETYDVEPERCREDVGKLLRELVDRGLVDLRE